MAELGGGAACCCLMGVAYLYMKGKQGSSSSSYNEPLAPSAPQGQIISRHEANSLSRPVAYGASVTTYQDNDSRGYVSNRAFMDGRRAGEHERIVYQDIYGNRAVQDTRTYYERGSDSE